jgi:hypothetical protein
MTTQVSRNRWPPSTTPWPGRHGPPWDPISLVPAVVQPFAVGTLHPKDTL